MIRDCILLDYKLTVTEVKSAPVAAPPVVKPKVEASAPRANYQGRYEVMAESSSSEEHFSLEESDGETEQVIL